MIGIEPCMASSFLQGCRSPASRAMAAYGAGDDSAFPDVYQDLAPRLFRLALRFARDRALAEDVVQLAFLKMHLARDRFQHGSDVLPWAKTITRRLAIDEVRRRRHEGPLPRDAEGRELTEQVPSEEPSGEETALAHELGSALRDRLETLPPLQRETFHLVRGKGLRAEQAAVVLGTTTVAVKLRFHRALESLREVACAQ
jgi:RNA polymerase sigma-70 factor (ECF subfamily)